MFMGPLEKEKIWNTDAVNGCKRFLNRVHELANSSKICEECSEEALKIGYRMVHGVCEDIEALQFNTAIAKMMEFMNDFTKLDKYPKKVVLWLAQALQPFAPHSAEEIWSKLKGKGELSYAPFPEIEKKYLIDDVTTYVVQINGKVRGRFDLPLNQTEEVILKAAKEHPQISKSLGDAVIQRVIFVPNKLLNIVT
jgi:leucyl-tRNA synthetase